MRYLFLALMAASVPALAAEPLPFWFEGDVSRVAGYQSVEDHPCGVIAIVKVDKLPPFGKGRLTSEKAVEMDASGKAIRRWPIPVDARPVAVRDNQLLFEYDRTRYWVEPDGKVQRAGKLSLPAVKETQCKTAIEFKDADYVHCEAFPDMGTRAPRTIAYEGACA